MKWKKWDKINCSLILTLEDTIALKEGQNISKVNSLLCSFNAASIKKYQFSK